MTGYISKEAAIDKIMSLKSESPAKSDWACGYDTAIAQAFEYIQRVPVVDAQPVVVTENMAAVSDEFVCRNCGIHLKDYTKVVLDVDNDGHIDEHHYDYEPKFCPECGAKEVNR